MIRERKSCSTLPTHRFAKHTLQKQTLHINTIPNIQTIMHHCLYSLHVYRWGAIIGGQTTMDILRGLDR